jgi:ADP-ribose pyrophosphatase
MCNTNLHFVHVKIDLTDERNKKPKQQLEENEFIEIFTVSLRDLYAECRKLEKEGFAIDARVGSLAEGFEIARKWKFL